MRALPQPQAVQAPLVLAQAEQTETSERLRKRRQAEREARRQQKQQEEAEQQAQDDRQSDDRGDGRTRRRDREGDESRDRSADRREERRDERAERRNRDDDEDSGRRNRRDRWDEYDDDDVVRSASRRCSAERALAKAERSGIRRARVVEIGRRFIEVRGRRYGERILVTFARDRNCSVIEVN
ncbi:MAG TPA: hypothetical protein VGN97_14330 [Mesorhizobium sp.]|jgi:hypothetical protein|nr:hypothetical protein [Mesorhizobium sp.]